MLEERRCLMHHYHVCVADICLQSTQPRIELRLLEYSPVSVRLRHSEGVFDGSDEFVVVDLACSDDVDVVADVVFVMVVFNHAFGDGLHVADVSQNGEADLLSLEDPSVCDLDGGLKRHGFPGFPEFAFDGASFVFDISFAIEGVGEHVADDADCSGDVSAEGRDHVGGVFSGGVSVEIGAHVFNL